MKDVVFVHIQKNAGTSIRNALGIGFRGKHLAALEIIQEIGLETWRSSYSFAFVRNPWDRLVSWWSMISQSNKNFHFFNYVRSNASTFEEFLLRCNEPIQDHQGTKWIWRNQMEYITDASGVVLVNFVGRYERLREDFATICQNIGCVARLKRRNKSRHRHYSLYYTPELANLVAERYARDIAAFGYRFEGP